MQLNWGAIVAGLGVYSAALAAVQSGYRAPATIRRAHGKERAALKLTISSDHVVPELVDLVVELNVSASRSHPEDLSALLAKSTIADTLDSAVYRPHIERLTKLYSDLGLADQLYSAASGWARRKAFASLLFAITLLPIAVRYSLSITPVPGWLLGLSLSSSVVLAAVAAACWRGQAHVQNRLTGLCEAYE